MGVIRDIHFLRNLRFWTLGHVQDARLAFDEGPFKAFLAAVDVDALAILTGDIVEEAPDVRGEVAVLNFDVCLLYTSPSPRDLSTSRMPSSA